MHIRTHVYTRTYSYERTNTYTRVNTVIYTYAFAHAGTQTQKCTHVLLYSNNYVCVHCTCVRAYVSRCVRAYEWYSSVYACMCFFIIFIIDLSHFRNNRITTLLSFTGMRHHECLLYKRKQTYDSENKE